MHIMAMWGQYTDLSLFLLRVMLAMIFGTTAFHHLQASKEQAASLGLSVGFTMFLGVIELAAAAGLMLGILQQWAALLLVVLLVGTIFLKAAKWNTSFWGDDSIGWHYDLMLLCMNLVILCTGGGSYVLLRPDGHWLFGS